jgi:hypothetical protein
MAHKYRLHPDPEQEPVLLMHCAHTRAIYNACVEQAGFWHRDWRGAKRPGYIAQAKELVEVRRELEWLGQGSSSVQQFSYGEDVTRNCVAGYVGIERPAQIDLTTNRSSACVRKSRSSGPSATSSEWSPDSSSHGFVPIATP